MELVFLNHKIEEENINLVVHHNTITGLVNDSNKTIFNLLSLKKIGRGQIIINNDKVAKDEIFINQKRVSEVTDNIIFPVYVNTVEELMNNYLRIYNLNVKDPSKKLKDSLKIVGIDEEYITHEVNTLSSSEKKLITIAIGLLSNPDTLILEEPFKYLDLKQEKRLYMLLQKFKEQYNKTIIIKSDNPDIIYKYTDEVIIVKNNNILVDGETKEVYQRVDFLKRNGINVPEIVMITYLAKKDKEVKIDYHKDIRDIIKDIYKHV